ncbi:MAG TPA: CoA-binding protein [Flavipsychrobacter sp.]|nr:CoA-binding protein [Flavipsychrobacter sp.]
MEQKKTLVLGASENTQRYSNRAVRMLRDYGHEVVALGRRKGSIGEVEITTQLPELNDIHTVTLYLNPENQKAYYDYIVRLKPKRVIFNPGTENEELERKVAMIGINTLEACTLVMLSTGQY